MGCDIHWYSETKIYGKWECDQAHTAETDEDGFLQQAEFPHSGRDYWFFGLLAGVRCDWEWGFKIKDFPADASNEVTHLYQQWDSDAHSPSYLTRAELKAKLQELAPKRAELLITCGGTREHEAVPNHATRLQQTITNLDANVPDEDQRIVFWFDN